MHVKFLLLFLFSLFFSLVKALPIEPLSDTEVNKEAAESLKDFFFPEDLERVLEVAQKIQDHKITGNKEEDNKFYSDSNGFVYNIETNSLNNTFDSACKTISNSFIPYTGYRMITSTLLTWNRVIYRRYSVMVYCYQGKVAAKAMKGIPPQERDILWGTEYCFPKEPINPNVPTPKGCLIPVRSSHSWAIEAGLLWTWNKPERAYGGIFRYNERLDHNSVGRVLLSNDLAIPVLPLITDEPYMGSVGIDMLGYLSINIPLAYTPDYYNYAYPHQTDIWAAYLDMNEIYLLQMPDLYLPFTHRIKTGFSTFISGLFSTYMSKLFKSETPATSPFVYEEEKEEKESGETEVGGFKIPEYNMPELIKRFGPEGGVLPVIIKDIFQSLRKKDFLQVLNRCKTRLALLENKHLAKYIYMEISRLLPRVQMKNYKGEY
ncbi:uncharacterized protein SAPINGB_P000416 [Magnusiomyces paraingens]|uniref:F-box domain-containing protein n=1 Tax=Magnusiomyces paraingens TaxID=2606893 RepID=A0A5E8AZQ6_9ASCO|nr:uncharacterized protein SAPINGB_P000416 [Saprochaete ingens]VVT44438.1 unnamed protein product [Saprochaete ingens]